MRRRGALFLLCGSARGAAAGGAAAGGAQEAVRRSASSTLNCEHSPRISRSGRGESLRRDTLIPSFSPPPPAPLGEIFGYFLNSSSK